MIPENKSRGPNTESPDADEEVESSGEEPQPPPEASGNGAPTEEEAPVGAGAPRVIEAGADAEGLRDRYLRLAAEFENYRKRTERERLETRDRSQAQLVERLLEPLDDLQRVAGFAPDAGASESLLEGVRMVEKKLLRILESSGLESVDPRGERFDPELHEALMTAAADEEAEDDTVGEVFQKGYRFRGHMLRPARVQVRKFAG